MQTKSAFCLKTLNRKINLKIFQEERRGGAKGGVNHASGVAIARGIPGILTLPVKETSKNDLKRY